MALALRHASRWIGVGTLGLLCGVSGSAGAAGSADPFKPPASLLNVSPEVKSTAAWMSPPPEAVASVAETDKTVPGLQGVRRGTVNAALIDGVWVPLGHTARGARLVSITAEGAALQHPDGRREFLALSPDARWTPHRAPVKEGRP